LIQFKHLTHDCIEDAKYRVKSHQGNVAYVTCTVTTLCLRNVHPYYLCDYSVKGWSILVIFGGIAAEQMFNLTYLFIIKHIWSTENIQDTG